MMLSRPWFLFALRLAGPLPFLNFFAAVSRRDRNSEGLTFDFPYVIENGAGRALVGTQTRPGK